MREASLAGEDVGRPADEWSFIDLDALSLVAGDGVAADLLPATAFVQPDDGNRDDRTLVRVALPTVVPPGGDIALRVSWRSRVPRTFSRTGRIADFYFIAHWFPKIAVYEAGRWIAHQFHANT